MLSRKVKIIINVVTILALALLLYFSWPDIQNGLKEIGGAKWSIIALMIPLQIFNFFAVGMIYYTFFGSGKTYKKVTKKAMLKVALELNFINSVFPSGGVAGFTYLGYRMKHYGVPVAKTTLAQTMRFVLTFTSFLILLFAGLLMLSLGDAGSRLVIYIGLSIAFLTLFGTFFGIYIISDKKRIKAFAVFLPKLLNYILGVFHKKKKKNVIDVDRVEGLFSDFHDDYEIMVKNRKKLKKPFFWALVVNISEVATIYLAYLALSQVVNPGAVILAYSVASFAGLIAVFPGGIGIYEALMTTVLTASGVPKALALSATLIYRIFTMMIFVPTGFILYQKALKKGEAKEIHRAGTPSPNAD